MIELNQETGLFLSRRLEKILHSNQADLVKLKSLHLLFELLFEKITQSSEIAFTTLFARMAFVTTHFKLPGNLNFINHTVRRSLIGSYTQKEAINYQINFAAYAIDQNLVFLYKTPSLGLTDPTKDDLNYEKGIQNSQQFYKIIKGVVKQIDKDKGQMLFSDEEDLFKDKWISLEGLSFVQDLSKLLEDINHSLDLPFQINLIDVSIDDNQVLLPKGFVLLPNFLVNITAVAEGFKYNGKFTVLSYLTRKLVPTVTSMPLLKGNIVNHILDELIQDPEKSFDELLPAIFKIFPVGFSNISDPDLRTLIYDLRNHYNHLRNTIKTELYNLGIDKDKIYLEPSFYSADYGFQGRLDLFHVNEEKSQVDIIELKSGKVFRPNVYKICVNHFVQTLLYGLLIDKIIARANKPSLYILYSSEKTNSLRFAPTIRAKQLEAIHERNKIILLENKLKSKNLEDLNTIIQTLNPDLLTKLDSFLKRDAKLFWELFNKLDSIEQSYYLHFVSFISREYHLSKTGEHGIKKSNGLASIWLDSLESKIDEFSVISYLKILENQTDLEYPTISFGFSARSNLLSKFRKGDIAVLYPFYNKQSAVLEHQIFKCNILEVSDQGVTIKLRYQQKNKEYFNRFEYWNLEYDVLDSSFNSSFTGLFNFISAKKEIRDQLLCRVPPRKYDLAHKTHIGGLTKEQVDLVNQILSCKDYFLLWGPPGTGKTSFMLRQIVKQLFDSTEENILLLAYTNRSVDEICEAVSSTDEEFDKFIRLGSRLSVDPKFKKQLLVNKIQDCYNRAQIRSLIQSHRIFIATVASVNSNRELFKLKKFDTIIIDEASQILEPSLIGILPMAKRFVLIGDHKQLPAVVTQSSNHCKVKDMDLKGQTGLSNLSVSFFERLYINAVKKKWTWAYGVLKQQGRMHKTIMDFSSNEFYEKKLTVLPSLKRLVSDFDEQALSSPFEFLSRERIVFVDTPLDPSIYSKINSYESKAVAVIIKQLVNLYQLNDRAIEERSIGIITPFRAQITQISNDLSSIEKWRKLISIDTVERYQGSARERIIISLTTNDGNLLDSMSNISEEGIDRKLNVALTRAKEQLIILGNRKLLETKKIYKALISASYCTSYDALFK